MAEGVGFEPTEAGYASAVFKTAAFDLSAIPPGPHNWEQSLYSARTATYNTRPGAERCWSGRSGLPAKQLSGVTWTAGSNPALSAILDPSRIVVNRHSEISHDRGLALFTMSRVAVARW